MPVFLAKGPSPKIWAWRTLHVEKPADESVGLWIREIKTHGEICWKQVKSTHYSPNFIETEPANGNTALFVGCCWVSLTGRFHRHSAAGWDECTVAGPGRARRHAAQFSERSSTPLIGHARVALSGVLTRLLSTQTNDTQRGGKGHKPLPTPYLPYLIRRDPRTFGYVHAFSLRFWYGPPLLVRPFCSFGTVICALLVRSGKRGRETCAFGVAMRGY